MGRVANRRVLKRLQTRRRVGIALCIGGMALGVAFVACLFALRAPLWGHGAWAMTLEELAWVGDAMGPFGSLFSFLALAAALLALNLQRQELELQRQEMRDQRREMKRSADAQRMSVSVAIAQIDAAEVPRLLEFLRNLASEQRTLIGIRRRFPPLSGDTMVVKRILLELSDLVSPIDSGDPPLFSDDALQARAMEATGALSTAREALYKATVGIPGGVDSGRLLGEAEDALGRLEAERKAFAIFARDRVARVRAALNAGEG